MPESAFLYGKTVNLTELKSPLDPAKEAEHLREGGAVYFKNCFLCHGDLLDGKGVFGESFFPPPADLRHPNSILSKPAAYAFWRIAKGGPGLPDPEAAADSAMPSWEERLSEEEIWKIILFIQKSATEMNRLASATAPEPSLERGQAVYREKCVHCHGETGKGDGPAAKRTSPRPRNFTKGQFKIRSTPFGKIPTDQDLMAMLERNYSGTSMPSWKLLPEKDRESLVLYIKSLSKKFQKFIDRKKKHQVIKAPNPPEPTPELLAAGEELFMQSCSGCHGVKGRSDGASTVKVVDIASDAIWPRNLTKPWLFRRGASLRDIYMTLRTGLSTTAMPRFSERTFKDEEIWAIVHYVRTLALPEKPQVQKTLRARKVEGALPDDPGDALWKEAEAFYFPLGGQLMAGERAFHPTVTGVTVKAAHNGDEMALHLEWDDPRVDPGLAQAAKVTESPPPPLPPHLRVEGMEEEEPAPATPQEFPDAIAVQFSLPDGAEGGKPYFLNGDAARPVYLWRWASNPAAAEEHNANGLTQWKKQPDAGQAVSSRAAYEYGRYSLVMKRKLQTSDKDDAQFEPGGKTPIAFNVWDGTVKETGSVRAVSSWFELLLE